MVTAEQKEIAVQSYARTFDKDMAYTKAGLSKVAREELDKDPEFQERLNLYLIVERERIIEKFRNFMDSGDEKVSFQATVKLAEVLYSDFFVAAKGKLDKGSLMEEPFTKEEARRLMEEYGLVIGSTNNKRKAK